MASSRPLPPAPLVSPLPLLEMVEDVLCLCQDDVIVWVNQAGAEQLGTDSQRLVGTSFLKLLHPDHSRTLVGGIAALQSDPKGLPMILSRPDGGTMAALVVTKSFGDGLHGIALRDLTGRMPAFDTLVRAVTRLEERARDLSRQASFDALTGLPNRTLFMDRLGQAVHQAERNGQMVGLMFIDLDGFKLVNDTLGHDMGDLLLQETARRLAACIRSGDTVARLGGDEFTVLMPNLGTYQNAPNVAGRILDILKKPFDLAGREAFVSGSIGITVFPDDATDAMTMLKNADAAMYRAKEHGKANFQFFTADMNAAVEERLAIKTGLSQALERGEMTLAFQPKLDLRTGAYTGVEALLRWNAAGLGQVSPAKFIPVMEESGLMGRVGEWAIDAACRQYRTWLEKDGSAPRVAINLSVRQLRAPGFVAIVRAALERSGLPASALEFEITEGMVMRDSENAVTVLNELTELGITLSMDDFGTGTSSLSVIRRFPVNSVKIDRSFVADIATDESSLEIIRAIISMGHALGRRIIAEGVETTDQVAALRRLGCDEIQGYVLAPPVSADRLADVMATPSTL